MHLFQFSNGGGASLCDDPFGGSVREFLTNKPIKNSTTHTAKMDIRAAQSTPLFLIEAQCPSE